jgi:bifunctional DNA-binding transcriptional regulator/antitoxin component of YhaV-PrlF toxin-antitoxin module
MNNKIGVLKDIDNLGRLVIPKEMRDTFKLDKSVELVVTEEGVLVRNPKYKLIEKEKVEGD